VSLLRMWWRRAGVRWASFTKSMNLTSCEAEESRLR
jgi:hypothetical protein